MGVVMDGLLIAGTLFAGVYCWVLSRRVHALKSLDSGLGGSIVTLTRQIELARLTLDEARAASGESRKALEDLVGRADVASSQLRLLLVAGKAAAPRAQPSRGAQAAEREPPPRAAEPPAPPPSISVRRRDGLGPRLVTLTALGDGAPREAEDPVRDDGVPKPRRTTPLDGLMRQAAQSAAPVARNEEDLIAALSALAAGAER